MDRSAITSAWVAGWTVSRGTAPAIPTPWGHRIEVGSPGHVFRHVLPEPDEGAVRKLCETITEPGAWLKVLVAPEDVAGWITPGWTVPDDPGWLMTTALDPAAPPVVPPPPPGYTLRTESADGVVRVSVPAPGGAIAAVGRVAPTGATAVVDHVVTEEEHRRRGLGRLVMRALERAAAEAGATTGILGATVDGRALYTALGWQVRAPLTGVVRG